MLKSYFSAVCIAIAAPFYVFAQSPSITCSEINYNSHASKASGNWIELHNYGTVAVNLGGYKLKEESVATFFTLPANTTITAGGFLVLSDDLVQFKAIYPAVSNVVGSTAIALGNNGDTIVLSNQAGATVLRIGYSDGLPWPQCADGAGRTLENKAFNTNGNLLDPANWIDGCMGGSPGTSYSPCSEPILFNEINYRSAPTADAGDWVEIWNRSGQSVNLSGWQFRDSNDTLRFTFPNGTTVASDSFLVVYNNLFLFNDVHPGAAPNKVGPFEFGLSGNGEVIRLFDQNKDIILSMFYNDAAPWPANADGLGATLELRAPFTDLNFGQNWAASCDYGTPGRKNSPCSSGTEEVMLQNGVSIAPNPASGICRVTALADAPERWQLLDMNGRLVQQGRVPQGQSQWQIDLAGISSGCYALRVNGADWWSNGRLIVK